MHRIGVGGVSSSARYRHRRRHRLLFYYSLGFVSSSVATAFTAATTSSSSSSPSLQAFSLLSFVSASSPTTPARDTTRALSLSFQQRQRHHHHSSRHATLLSLFPIGSSLATSGAEAASSVGLATTRRTQHSVTTFKMAATSSTSTTSDGDEEGSSSTSKPTSKSWRVLLEDTMKKTRDIRGTNYVQVSTVEYNNDTKMYEPKCRTIVFRGFVENIPPNDSLLYNVCDGLSCVMKMCTNKLSQKVRNRNENNKNNDMAEMVWWFPQTMEQYRVRGHLIFVGEPSSEGSDSSSEYSYENDPLLIQERCDMWESLRDVARETFYDPRISSMAYDDNDTNTDMDVLNPYPGGRDPATGKVIQPPSPNFILMLLNPISVDYLQLAIPKDNIEQYRQVDVRRDDEKEKKGEGGGMEWSYQRVNP